MSSVKKVSLKDVAEAAGVSTTLVSFVLNGNNKEYRVGEETSRRILKIAREMNYQPNIAAKSLRSGKTRTIGLVVSDISNPFFAQLARVVEDEVSRRGYSVLFGSSDEDRDRMGLIVSNLINKGVDGLIIVPCENSESTIKSLVKNRVPLVLFDRYFPDINVNYVALNNFGAAYTLTCHLLNSGFEAPCMVAYDINLIHMKERIRGYMQAMEDAGKTNLANVVYFKHRVHRKTSDRIIAKAIEGGADAFVFATNMISLTCLYAIRDLGFDVASRIGLAAFDENPAFDFFNVPIYSIKQPINIMAHKALDILIDNMTDGSCTVQSVLAEGELVDKMDFGGAPQ